MLMLTRHPVGGKVMVKELNFQVSSGYIFWVSHSYSQQDSHQQVHYLCGEKREGEVVFLCK